jgi:ankyrin repeat protein
LRDLFIYYAKVDESETESAAWTLEGGGPSRSIKGWDFRHLATTAQLFGRIGDLSRHRRLGLLEYAAQPKSRMWRFPKLTSPRVFLASPGDVAYLRKAVVTELNALKQQVADDRGVDLFAWEIDLAKDGFDASLPAQAQIPLPVGPFCRAVVCLLGEKIGTPLPEEFPLDALAPLNPLEPGRAYRLVHPWKPQEADFGGFALTGTTFEYLAAVAANFQGRADPVSVQTHAFLGFVGDESIRDPQVPPVQANWGCRLFRREARERFRENDEALADWIAGNLNELKQLRNFIRFIESLGLVVKIVRNLDEAKAEVRAFLIRSLHLRVSETDRDPFKGLEIYDVDDSTVFYGRSLERSDAVTAFLTLWNDSEKPTSFSITGGSGVGKSSFLRAGVVARLRSDNSSGSFLDCVVRPAELLAPDVVDRMREGYPISPGTALERLYLLASVRIAAAARSDSDPQLADAQIVQNFDFIAAEQQAAWTVARLSDALTSLGPAFTLIIAFDQFEEIVDQRRDTLTGPIWQPVVEFIALAARNQRIGILYTVQANRDGLIADDPVLGPLWATGGQQRLVFPEQSIPEIIRRPFEITGKIQIAPNLVTALTERITIFKNKESSAAFQGSLLPLVSLTLQRIYQKLALPLLADLSTRQTSWDEQSEGRPPASGPRVEMQAASRANVELTPENCKEFFKIEDAIAELAEEATAEAKAASGPEWADTTLGDLFRRLVELRGEQYGLPDAVVPSAPAPRRLAEALRKRRLLLPAEEGRVRLVHEAVLHHWSQATKWLDGERPLLRDAAGLVHHAREWDAAESRSSVFLEGFGLHDIDSAARLLWMWYDLFTDSSTLTRQDDRILLRDFALALLGEHPMPSRIVERAPQKPTHLMVTALYGRAEIVRRYLESEPESLHLQRPDKRTAIFSVCFLGNEEILDMFLEHDATVDEPDVDGWRPVHAAATAGNVNCLARLMERGASLETSGPHGTTLLHLAARNKHVEMLDFLLEQSGLSPSVTDENGWTPLHTAASLGLIPAVTRLVGAGANLEAQLPYGWTPLHIAIENRQSESVKALLEAGATPRSVLRNGWTPLHLAARYGQTSNARRLLQYGADPLARAKKAWPSEETLKERGEKRQSSLESPIDWQPIHVAADHDTADLVTELLRSGADPDARTADLDTPLHVAARKGHRTVVLPLITAKADPESRNNDQTTPFQLALEKRQFSFAGEIVRYVANVDSPVHMFNFAHASGWTHLHQAAYTNRPDIAKFLLDHGANANAETDQGQTPLHFAAYNDAEMIVELLIEHGAHTSAAARDGTTPLHLACLAGKSKTVKRFLELIPSRARYATIPATPLHLAAYGWMAANGRHHEVARMLLDSGHPLDCPDHDGWTPLHVAALNGSAETVNLLLERGAQTNSIATRPALTPLAIAASVHRAEIVDLLTAPGADVVAQRANSGSGSALLPLHFGLRGEPGPYDAVAAFDPSFNPSPKIVAQTVLERDNHTCRFCGFKSRKYQWLVALHGNFREVDDCVTACSFCTQAAYLDIISPLQSGVMIWLPEFRQTDLNRVMGYIYVARHPGTPQ